MSDRPDLAPVTSWNQGAPAINGPDVVGASRGKPFLYAVPTTGERPLTFSAEGLPPGLRLDAATGHIVGGAEQEGEWRVLVAASNGHGHAVRELEIAIGKGLALTPPMGWNSWNAWRRWVDADKVKQAAEALVSQGLAARGYAYVNIDSCWQGARGGPRNALRPNRKFPDMKGLAHFLHGLGLKFGLYSTPWTKPWGCSDAEAIAEWGGPPLMGSTSGERDEDPIYNSMRNSLVFGFVPHDRYVGRTKHEADDVAEWAEWGVDMLKYDWLGTDPLSTERMGRLLRDSPRDVIFSICTDARLKHAETYTRWCHMFRGIHDTADEWPWLVRNHFHADEVTNEDWRPHIGPGHWYDLDILALGPQFQDQTSTRPNRLTEHEQVAHMTLWAIYPSPLILSCDVTKLRDFELRLFANEEVLAINQDRLGRPALRVFDLGETPRDGRPPRRLRAYARELSGGKLAVALFNFGPEEDSLDLDLGLLGVPGAPRVRDAWARHDMGRREGRLVARVPSHGARLFVLT